MLIIFLTGMGCSSLPCWQFVGCQNELNPTSNLGTGEIEVFRINNETGLLGSLIAPLQNQLEEVKRDTYLSVNVTRAFFVDLPSLKKDKDWRLALKMNISNQEWNHVQEGTTRADSKLNFLGIPVMQYYPWKGESIGMDLDVIQVNAADRDRWNQAVGNVLKGSNPTGFLPPPISLALGSVDLNKIAKEIIDRVLADKKAQFPFVVVLHELPFREKLSLVSPLINGNYVMMRLRTNEPVQTWTRDRITKELKLSSGVLYKGNEEFRARSYVVLTAISTVQRPSYSSLKYYSVLNSAVDRLVDRLDQGNIHSALTEMENALRTLSKDDAPFLTRKDLDARRYYMLTHKHLWSARNESDSDPEVLQTRQQTHVREALSSWQRIPKGAFPSDDITGERYETTLRFICAAALKDFVPPDSQTDMDTICEKRAGLEAILVQQRPPGPPRPGFPDPPFPVWKPQNLPARSYSLSHPQNAFATYAISTSP
jgi:hypothetical protein